MLKLIGKIQASQIEGEDQLYEEEKLCDEGEEEKGTNEIDLGENKDECDTTKDKVEHEGEN